MNIGELLDEIKGKIINDPGLCRAFLDTRREANPLSAFCRECRELGYEIYEMDVIDAGEEFYAAIKRSTNGGGENSPLLKGEDDFYELFFADMESGESEENGKGKKGKEVKRNMYMLP